MKYLVFLFLLLPFSLLAQKSESAQAPEASGEMDVSNYGYSFSRHIGAIRELGLDVVFVFDSTGSMQPTLDAAKSKIKEIDSMISALVPDYRLGVYTYRDKGDLYEFEGVPLSTYHDEAIGFLNETRAGGGGDVPEGINNAFEKLFKNAGFRKSAVKVVFLIGDAPSHDADKLLSLIKKQNAGLLPFNEENSKKYRARLEPSYIVNTIQVPCNMKAPKGAKLPPGMVIPTAEEIAAEYRQIAETTGGMFEQLENASEVTGPMLTLVFGKRFEKEINQILDDVRQGKLEVPLGLKNYTSEKIMTVILGDSNSAVSVINKMLDSRAPEIETGPIEKALKSRKIRRTEQRIGLCHLLGKLGRKSSFKVLTTLAEKDRAVGVRVAALRALAGIPHDKAQDYVINMINDSDLRAAACRIVAEHRWLPAVETMLKYAKPGSSPEYCIVSSIQSLTDISIVRMKPGRKGMAHVVNQAKLDQVRAWLESHKG